MNITEHEMRGLLTGKCIPGDMLVNEQLPAYLVRKFAELKAQRDALAAENASMMTLAIACEKEFGAYTVEEFPDDAKVSYPEERCNITFGMIRQALNKTATDAYLNSVRADAISGALDECSDHCDTDCVMDAYDFSYEIAEMRSAGAIELHDGLVAYANELRAGKAGE
ncbi:hypothetical protein [Pantoea agglomerans]|uniref:hypothetical protein n=2 Tax=Enterobacter agglomerans TaxID=549 RepID=UPI003208713B